MVDMTDTNELPDITDQIAQVIDYNHSFINPLVPRGEATVHGGDSSPAIDAALKLTESWLEDQVFLARWNKAEATRINREKPAS